MVARLLAIMGSGETTPTMAKVHRHLLALLGGSAPQAVLLDTPYGFQGNARDISARAMTYFRESVGLGVEVAAVRADGPSALEQETALGQVAAAAWVFSGPGSPTYALRQWRPTALPHLLTEKLSQGGCVVMSSAAAMTLGRWTVPVYEIYKVGGEVAWVDGLDLLAPLGLDVAVIPHFDNAEGGNHDTRYSYLGEQRLRMLEAQLPEEGWVLGVDEHTACIIDLEAGTVNVAGIGVVSVRRAGVTTQLAAGTTLGLDELINMGARGPGGSGLAPTGTATSSSAATGLLEVGAARAEAPPLVKEEPLVAEVRRLSTAFEAAFSERDAPAALGAVFDLEESLHAWSADTFESDQLDRARAALRRMLARLGDVVATGMQEPRSVVAPWVGALLAERSEARRDKRFADGDRIRDRLVELGIEVRDTSEGSEWELRPTVNPGP
jgi:cyanophycinase-like exopeptidase